MPGLSHTEDGSQGLMNARRAFYTNWAQAPELTTYVVTETPQEAYQICSLSKATLCEQQEDSHLHDRKVPYPKTSVPALVPDSNKIYV